MPSRFTWWDATSKPPWWMPINTENYVAQSLQAAYLMAEGTGTTLNDVVSRYNATWSGLTWGTGTRGPAAVFSGAGKAGTGITLNAAQGTIILDFTRASSSVDNERIIGAGDSSGGSHGVELTWFSGNFYAVFRNGGANGDVNTSIPATKGVLLTAAVSWGPAGTKLYTSGIKRGTGGLTSGISTGGLTLNIGGPGSGASPNYVGTIERYLVYSRQLGDEEVYNDFAEPYRAWVSSTESRFWFPSAAPAASSATRMSLLGVGF